MMPAELPALLSRVRRRMRAQAALEGATRAAVLAGAAAAVAVYLYRLGPLSRRGLYGALLFAGGLVLAAALWRALRKIPLERAAKRIDLSHALHDRVGSALAFSRGEATPFMQAAIADAAQASRTVDARKAAPFSRPDSLGAAGVAAGAALLVALLHFPGPTKARFYKPDAPPGLAVERELLEPERESVEQLAQEALETGDPDQKKLADELKQLLDQVDNKELTRKQVFDKLAQIEKKLDADPQNLDELKKGLKAAGAELAKEKPTRDAGEALKNEDLKKAREELEKLAAEAQKLAEQQKKELARSLDRTAQAEQQRQLKKSEEEQKRDAEEKRLKEEQRRLQRELAQKPNDRETQRKLERNKRELEKLEREKQQMAEQRRKLERLEREMQKAAEEMRKQMDKMSPEAREALRKMAQQMGQMENEIKKLGNGQKMQMQIAQLKEVFRRAGQQGQGQPQNGDGSGTNLARNNGQHGDQKGDQGRNDGKGKGTLLKDFNDRAKGDQKDQTLILGENDGNGQSVILPLPMGPGDKPGQQGEGHEMPQQKGSGGIGDQHDPNMLGDKTKLAAKHVDSHVDGKKGAGPSKSETILGSAERGFASSDYKKVYADYSSVVEEVLSKERIPPGYRYFVKRYFQLIRPRE
jgi:hypothetical protein